MSRSLAVESEQLLGVVRKAAVNHEARYYMLHKARYPASRAENMRYLVLLHGHWPGMRLRRWIQKDIFTVLPLLLGMLVNVLNPQTMSYSAVTDVGLVLLLW